MPLFSGLTSRLHAIDPCFLRSGRLDTIHELTFTSPKQRYDVLHILTKSKATSPVLSSSHTIQINDALSYWLELPFGGTDRYSILQLVAQKTHGFVPSDLQSVCSQVTLQLMKELQVLIISAYRWAILTVYAARRNERAF